MTDWTDLEASEFAKALIHSRQNISPRRLSDPGPSSSQLEFILGAAAAAPDHGQLTPWRFVVVPSAQRSRLANAFGLALLDRDPQATHDQLENAREKAYRAPFLMLAIACLKDQKPLENATGGSEINDAERLVSLGCAIQNILLCAHANGFGTGVTSGQAMASPPLRALFSLQKNEQAVCCINIGTVTKIKPPRLRPDMATFVTWLDNPSVR
jgi:nitroreductase